MTTTQKHLKTVDPQTLKQMLDVKLAVLVDVREPGEYAGERIAGSTLEPLSRFNPENLPDTNGKQLVLHCQTGNRSAKAAEKLFASGFDQVTHLAGGLNAWKDAGLPTLSNKNAPISLMRQVQIVAGSLILLGTLLGVFVSPWFLLLAGFVGAGLTFAGISGSCLMAMLLAKLPYNQRV